jgi:A nuclease family of the HNH/ENDO VII superfamily with conserved AHH
MTLAGNARKKVPGAAPAAPRAANILSLTIAANRVSGNSPGANSYELRNEILNRERIRYESDGRTVNGYTADQLFENAKSAGNHRRTLARNIDKGSGVARPAAACAHHVVASQAIDAFLSREHIFGCGIGINDVDNGVYLPRFKNVPVPSLPNASLHGPIHTARYHLSVFARLRALPKGEAPPTRVALRDMKDDMVAGVFPF